MTKKRNHGKAAEGNVFQVNDQPQEPNNSSSDHGSAPEGNAFQVNGHPAEEEEVSDST